MSDTEMVVGVVGALGNMGRRYCAILAEIGIPHVLFDIGQDPLSVPCDRYIIATPTETHFSIIKDIRGLQPETPILCEKPLMVCRSSEDVGAVCDLVKKDRNLFMVNNYKFTHRYWPPTGQNTLTSYEYYNSGPHGLAWDCIQLVHMAQGELRLTKKSPIWRCLINGREITRSRIDISYLQMIKAFVGDEDGLWSGDDIANAHQKAFLLAETMENV